MTIVEIIENSGMSKYKLSKESGLPHTTLNDICSRKTDILRSSSATVYKLAKALNVPMEFIIEGEIAQSEKERAFEYGLPAYLQKDLDAFKDGLKNKSTLMDCLWGELYGSINSAEIDYNAITHEHAEYLRDKYLRGKL